MLTAARALVTQIDSGKPLPKVPELEALYRYGVTPRHGQVIMIAGRSGTQKSGFALWWTAQMNLPTLYFSADMSGFTASLRLASMVSGHGNERIEAEVDQGNGDYYTGLLNTLNMTFSFGSPIRWQSVDEELLAYVELWDAYPQVIVFDNLMDFEDAEASYDAQMRVMQVSTELARDTGATVIVLHHASDKSWEAKSDPWAPPSRDQIKNGMGEKPELCLGVALDKRQNIYRIATLKQRMGRDDPTGQTSVMLRADPEHTRFFPFQAVHSVSQLEELDDE